MHYDIAPHEYEPPCPGGCGARWVPTMGAYACGFPLGDCPAHMVDADEAAWEAAEAEAFEILAPALAEALDAARTPFQRAWEAHDAEEYAFATLLAEVREGTIWRPEDIQALDALEVELDARAV